MYICSSGHEEVAHENLTCPVCDIMTDRDLTVMTFEKEIAEKDEIISGLEDEVHNLKG